jgi:hypothetical protein
MKGGAQVPPFSVVTQQRHCFGQATAAIDGTAKLRWLRDVRR